MGFIRIFLTTQMRTGSTWVADMLASMLGTSWDFWKRGKNIPKSKFKEEIKKPITHNIVIKLHYAHPKTICECIPKGDTKNFVVSITRDIRDVAISKILYIRYDKPMRSLERLKKLEEIRKKFDNKKVNDKRYINMFIASQFFNGIVKGWQMYNDGYTHPNYACITYELLWKRRLYVMSRLANFLHTPRSNKSLRQIIVPNNFQNKTGREKGKGTNNSFRRKGIIGDYQNYINKRNLNRIKELIKDFKYEAYKSNIGGNII